ncbi:RAB-protein geranylgeranyltransferase [Coprinopsis cinerea okayama7|uniref:Geranylgeranyl transferase type-2 subunit alpha n=1 Tax=Coprinopsis cinerea (strain Okayama-7 / 130 / ATCC MYA-4618 / FGSC 9003) TaxID=240176 RepID=A8NFY5_COPC7|nr:RAB-protein geranylgeranyltransferase [Coprinopsis cinerea okayama7\|eukprot:XP_001833430.2 RAB-protein geranylgeranyltransferase [Coprinopsis cinerea okayama7\
MHGIKRVKQTPEALEARKQKERAKIQEFTALSEDLLRRKKESDYSEDAFKLTTRLLHINPEFYTIWNYRRNILLKGLFTVRILTDELGMTMAALKSHPKVYWIWNHRRWCLENIPFGPGEEGTPSHNDWRNTAWNNELYVVEKLLDADARNFHAWDYRRYVLASMPVPRPELSELGYTSRKIGANFSNFSAWHQRSKVLPRLWEAGTLDEKTSRESEFELVRNAMYTEPADQSVWVYHRWLVGSNPDKVLLLREIEAINELLEEQPDSKWCMESTVHYSRLFIKLYPSDPAAAGLFKKCQKYLKELEVLDPYRAQRYRDLASTM